MKVTCIMQDFTDEFYTGHGDSIIGFNTLTNAEKFDKCKRLSADKRIKMKIESGQFRDAVELNAMMRSPCNIEFKIEPRRGYKLATFEISKA